jgi:GTP-binding protein HflX
MVVGPYLTRAVPSEHRLGQMRSAQERLDEACGLAAAIDLDIIGSTLVPLAAIRPATYVGTGRMDEIAARVKDERIDLVIMDCALSPVQQRNLEKAWSAKVLDRTGLILEIFGRRARTREGTLQVELAHLEFQRSRLVRSWTHLERQRGGFGFLGGPGESQLEADRRLIQERIRKIERDLEQVKQTRRLHRRGRQRVPYPIVALVGYTNAGKSTLFNRLTQAEVLAADMLFATLDPTLRSIALPHGRKIMLSDTVGFISDLPTQLIAAFRATLEEVVEADIILHVRDVAHSQSQAQAEDVTHVLEALDVSEAARGRIIEIWNKVDLLAEADRAALAERAARLPQAERPMIVSALTGEGVDAVLPEIERRLAGEARVCRVLLPADDGAAASWLYRHTEVLDRKPMGELDIEFTVRVDPAREDELRRRFQVAA